MKSIALKVALETVPMLVWLSKSVLQMIDTVVVWSILEHRLGGLVIADDCVFNV